jgi:hypothetical protein
MQFNENGTICRRYIPKPSACAAHPEQHRGLSLATGLFLRSQFTNTGRSPDIKISTLSGFFQPHVLFHVSWRKFLQLTSFEIEPSIVAKQAVFCKDKDFICLTYTTH